MESELPAVIRVKVVAKNIQSLFEETYKFYEPNCYCYMFSLINSTLV